MRRGVEAVSSARARLREASTAELGQGRQRWQRPNRAPARAQMMASTPTTRDPCALCDEEMRSRPGYQEHHRRDHARIMGRAEPCPYDGCATRPSTAWARRQQAKAARWLRPRGRLLPGRAGCRQRLQEDADGAATQIPRPSRKTRRQARHIWALLDDEGRQSRSRSSPRPPLDWVSRGSFHRRCGSSLTTQSCGLGVTARRLVRG